MTSPNDHQLVPTKAIGSLSVSFLKDCQATSEVEQSNNIRQIFQDIHASLKAYFSGQKNPISNASCVQRLGVRRYIDLYSLIWHGWNEIKDWAKQIGADIPQTPGAYLAEIIEWDYKVMLSECVEHANLHPRRVYEFPSKKPKTELLKAKEELDPKQARKIKAFERQLKKYRPEDQQYLGLHDFVICVAKCSGKHQEMLKRYESTCVDLDEAMAEQLQIASQS